MSRLRVVFVGMDGVDLASGSSDMPMLQPMSRASMQYVQALFPLSSRIALRI